MPLQRLGGRGPGGRPGAASGRSGPGRGEIVVTLPDPVEAGRVMLTRLRQPQRWCQRACEQGHSVDLPSPRHCPRSMRPRIQAVRCPTGRRSVKVTQGEDATEPTDQARLLAGVPGIVLVRLISTASGWPLRLPEGCVTHRAADAAAVEVRDQVQAGRGGASPRRRSACAPSPAAG